MIEVDGSQHSSDECRGYDRERSKFFNSLKIKVIRFRNKDVFTDTKRVLDKIKKEIA